MRIATLLGHPKAVRPGHARVRPANLKSRFQELPGRHKAIAAGIAVTIAAASCVLAFWPATNPSLDPAQNAPQPLTAATSPTLDITASNPPVTQDPAHAREQALLRVTIGVLDAKIAELRAGQQPHGNAHTASHDLPGYDLPNHDLATLQHQRALLLQRLKESDPQPSPNVYKPDASAANTIAQAPASASSPLAPTSDTPSRSFRLEILTIGILAGLLLAALYLACMLWWFRPITGLASLENLLPSKIPLVGAIGQFHPAVPAAVSALASDPVAIPACSPFTLRIQAEHGSSQPLTLSRHKVDPALLIGPGVSLSLHACYQDAAAHLLTHSDQLGSRLFITSPRPSDGKTCTAFNLAWALAESRKSVLLVELNFARPRLRSALGDLKLHYGLESVLHGAALPAECVVSVESTTLHMAPVRTPTHASKILPIVAHLHAFLDWGTENYDFLILDCPSVLSSEWNLWLRKCIGPSLLVVREDHTPLVEIQHAIRLILPCLQGALINAASHLPDCVGARPQLQAQQRKIPLSGSLSQEMRPPFLPTHK